MEVTEGLGDRMKAVESTYQVWLDNKLPFTVRLDGNCFSKLTSGVRKPFDPKFAHVMDLTCVDLLEKFCPRFVYTQSDEISLGFYLGDSESSEHIFRGRVDKIVTVIASYATARFNHHLAAQDWSEYSESVKRKMCSHAAVFDGRAFTLDDTQMANHVVWRCAYDCVRNTTLNYAIDKFGHKTVHGWDTIRIRNELKTAGVDWDVDVPPRAKYGAFFKKRLVEAVVDIPAGPRAGTQAAVTRTRVTTFHKKFDRADEANITLLRSKYLDDAVADAAGVVDVVIV